MTDAEPETPSSEGQSSDSQFAMLSLVYLLAALAFFLWLLFDIWVGRYTLAVWLGYRDQATLQAPFFQLVAFAFAGGGLGGVLNGIRSVIHWYGDENTFAGRYIWKYIALPWQGATLALVVYALITSGVAVLGGEIPLEEARLRQIFSVFGVGVLAGYGSRDVTIWLDQQVTKIFRREEGGEPEGEGEEGPQDGQGNQVELDIEEGEVEVRVPGPRG